jgi:SAM-dependent methyltransferase
VTPHPAEAASELVVSRLDALRALSRRGPILDLACGRGRHALCCAAAGCRSLAMDRDAAALGELCAAARARGLPLSGIRADIESIHGIPLKSGSCAAILVFRFLFRPLAAAIRDLLSPGGLLIYETFTVRQRELGYGPKNPSFLLEPGELSRLFPGLRIEFAWEGRTRGERPLELAQLVARKPAGPDAL